MGFQGGRVSSGVAGPSAPTVGIVGSLGLAPRLAARAEGKTATFPVRTPYGSVDVLTGTIGGGRFAAVAKAGVAPFPGHNLPYRANLYALSKAGCTRVLSASLATSVSERLHLADCFVPDDFIDLTGRSVTFFDGGLEGTHHAEMEAPFCARLAREFSSACRSFGMRVALGGVVATVVGPHQPTAAEAARIAAMGAQAVSFSAATEAKLARELGLCLVSGEVIVREAAGHHAWRPAGGGEALARPTEAELLRAFAEGREAPEPAPTKAKAPGKSRGGRARSELERLQAALKDVDARFEEAAAAFIPHAAALAPCPHCPAGAGPVPRD